jgi:hypothetical protein
MLANIFTRRNRRSPAVAPLSMSAFAKSGAYGTGSWTDTSPRFGCCLATKVAIWELAENMEASNFSLTVVRYHRSLVPIGELVDFAGR